MPTVTALEAKNRFVPEGRPALDQIRQAVGELRALRRQMAKRRGYKPLSDKEIRHAIQQGRP